MLVYRIEREKYLTQTLKGIGAALAKGFRWNSLNTFMVHTAESRALALLEISIHFLSLTVGGCFCRVQRSSTPVFIDFRCLT